MVFYYVVVRDILVIGDECTIAIKSVFGGQAKGVTARYGLLNLGLPRPFDTLEKWAEPSREAFGPKDKTRNFKKHTHTRAENLHLAERSRVLEPRI